jgi:siroheme synthase
MVHLVGAGPGDPDLLTVKAHRLLQGADVIVYDRMVSAEVVAVGRRDAEQVCVSREEAAQRVMTFARAGRSVVRLASGSSIAEFETLWAVGIPVEIVPGVPESTPTASSVKFSG